MDKSRVDLAENPTFLEGYHRMKHGSASVDVFSGDLYKTTTFQQNALEDGVTKVLRPADEPVGRVKANWMGNELDSAPKIENPMPFIAPREYVLNTDLR